MDIKREDIPEAIWDRANHYSAEFDARFYGDSPPPRELWVEFEAWLKADPRHAFAYQHMENAVNRIYKLVSGRDRPEPRQS